MLIEDLISKIKPDKVLEIGCGCGNFTKEIAKFCKHITATDVSEKLIERCKEENNSVNIEYLQMNVVRLNFKNDAFGLVFERDSLHHIPEWENALDEMIRVSSKHIILSEPLDDDRSIEKVNNTKANDFFLEIQGETGYTHFRHLTLAQFKLFFHKREIKFNYNIKKSDNLHNTDDFFEPFERFAKESKRYEYWMKRVKKFKKDLGNKLIADNDTLIIDLKKITN
jgi:ubiquinone/menaquinone biosynthesis C-methylase UbiE